MHAHVLHWHALNMNMVSRDGAAAYGNVQEADSECGMIAGYEVELAVPGDVAGIAGLSRNAIEHGLPWRWTPQRVGKSMADSSSNVVVVRQSGELAGFAIMEYEDDEAHLVLLAVHPGQRRKRIGSALISWLETTARTAGIGLIRLETRARNAEAIAFYRTLGFQELELRKGYYLGLENGVCMAKDLWLPP
jgi:ribosomal-protein-alanine N-acetyltransferase